MRCDGKKIDKATPGNYLRAALEQLELTQPGLGWYEATRHTFASQWVLAGRRWHGCCRAPSAVTSQKETWAQNGIQPRGVESLPQPTPDLFAQAGAILAKRAARGGATDSELATIIARSSAQAARLVVEGAPSASAEQRGQRHGP